MQLGTLVFDPIADNVGLVADPIRVRVEQGSLSNGIFVTAIDPELADTAAFCEHYAVPLDISANCIIVEAKRADRTWYIACLVRATDMLDVNDKIRRTVDARKASFAARDITLQLTNMEYGGITPLGLPDDWPILIDEKVAAQEQVIIGGGIRGSKIVAQTYVLTGLSGAQVLNITK